MFQRKKIAQLKALNFLLVLNSMQKIFGKGANLPEV